MAAPRAGMRYTHILCGVVLLALLAPWRILAADAPGEDDNPFEPAGPGPSDPLPKWAIIRLGAGAKSPLAGAQHVALSPDARRAAAGDARRVCVWNVSDGAEVSVLDLKQTALAALSFTPDGRALITSGENANENEKVRLWDATTGKLQASLGPGAPRAQILADGATLTVAGNGTLVRYSLATAKELDRVTIRNSPLAISPDGKRLAVLSAEANEDGLPHVELRDIAGESYAKLDGLPRPPSCALFSTDGSRFVAADCDHTYVRVWSVAAVVTNSARAPSLNGHAEPVTGLAFSPDGRHLATASADKTVVIWELDTGKAITTLRGHASGVNAVTFSQDGLQLATAAGGPNDVSVVVWDLTGALFVPSRLNMKNEGPEVLGEIWDDLASSDPKVAYGAIGSLLINDNKRVAYIAEQLRPQLASAVPQAEIKALVQQLDDDDFFVRDNAQKRLLKLRLPADRALRAALAASPTAEMSHRISKILEVPLSPSTLKDHERRQLRRAMLALELIATPAAASLLDNIAGGYPDAIMMNEAAACWYRLNGKPPRE